MIIIGVGAYLIIKQGGFQKKLPEKSEPPSVKIENFAFDPQSIRIKAGDILIWTNYDTAPHKILSDQSSATYLPDLVSDELSRLGQYGYKFNQPGTYNYYCSIHPDMKGTVIVE
ncbi:MAG: hypothetical protein A2174_03585 [Candidatus Portnoybacteria bacterium RBG_13_41_18]|uniref:Blue (type 1) copper domain-containing protein n=1 Tax=Candidatus Portnoybacteria bacterium RBG_13_41_18 TaxID=1801991 RepID=A0A1G2F852_9BACT|nr:MAG: hypothetical protein A2174_03585 [Candidatus Portnoybacteria bacterium RBG_13_41_18]